MLRVPNGVVGRRKQSQCVGTRVRKRLRSLAAKDLGRRRGRSNAAEKLEDDRAGQLTENEKPRFNGRNFSRKSSLWLGKIEVSRRFVICSEEFNGIVIEIDLIVEIDLNASKWIEFD